MRGWQIKTLPFISFTKDWKELDRMIGYLLRWIVTLAIAFVAGKLMVKIKMPSILGWLIVGMLLGPHAIGVMPQKILDTGWYKTVIMWMQCAFGVMLGTELIWKKLKSYGKAQLQL